MYSLLPHRYIYMLKYTYFPIHLKFIKTLSYNLTQDRKNLVPPNFQKLIFSAQGIHLRVPVCDHVRDVDIKTGVHLVCVHVFFINSHFFNKRLHDNSNKHQSATSGQENSQYFGQIFQLMTDFWNAHKFFLFFRDNNS